MQGHFSFVLHSHIPYVLSHGRWPHGTDWLSEACAETYIPLLNTINQLIEEGLRSRLTIGLTPVLCEQLASANFRDEFNAYLKLKIKAAEADCAEFAKYGDDQYLKIAQTWRNFYEKVWEDFNHRYHQDIIAGFKELQDSGYIEIITSAATHGYLPLLKEELSIQGQIRTGIESYRKYFGKAPKGIWLPECAYRPRYLWQPPDYPSPPYERPGIDEFLSDEGIEYFIVDSHLLTGGKAIGVYLSRFDALKRLWQQFEKEFEPTEEKDFKPIPYEPYLVGSNPKKKPVAFFTRDPKTALQVWSGEWGYPGDGWYLDFHKKRFPGGLRYWRVTDPKIDLGQKQIYEPDRTEARVQSHAQHFIGLIKETLNNYYNQHQKPGFLCIPYDAELFGHWWFEGTRWLYYVFKFLAKEKAIGATTCSNFLKDNYPSRVIALPEGSWGEGGFHYIWLNEDTKWTWKIIYQAEEEFKKLLSGKESFNSVYERILKQLARELLLLQASDWQFLISTWHARDYAEQRFLEHSEKFEKLTSLAKKLDKAPLTPEEINYLIDCEKSDAIFPDLDLSWFLPRT
ncbi:MAG: 1,4-alpha-glucan branching protein domain-containing protein [candidate division WOR-3 bacterium]